MAVKLLLEDAVLVGGAPGVADLAEVVEHGGLVLGERFEDGAGLPDEDAGVPVEVAGGQVPGGRCGVGFFAELFLRRNAGGVALGDLERGAALDVAEALGRVVGGDAEGDDPVGVVADELRPPGGCRRGSGRRR